MTKTGKIFSILKALLIAALIFSAGYIAFAVPEAAEALMPVVSTIKLEPCEYKPFVTANGTIVKRDGVFFAVVAVNEADISQVEFGRTAQLSGAAFPEGGYIGKVSGIADAAYTVPLSSLSASETVVDVTVIIEEGDTSKLRSGYSVTAKLKTGEERILNMLPYSAIRQDDRGEYVYVLNSSTAVRRDIVTGMEMSDKTEVVSGVEDSERIIASPESVSDGGRVRVKTENE